MSLPTDAKVQCGLTPIKVLDSMEAAPASESPPFMRIHKSLQVTPFIGLSTQKTIRLIVACCLLWFASEGQAQEELPDPPKWHVDREIDPITDEKRVFAKLRGRTAVTTTRDGAITKAPTISIWCNTQGTWVVRSPQGDLKKDFSLEVQITSPGLRPEFDPDNPNRPGINYLAMAKTVDRDVIVRFDSEKPAVERWGTSGGDGGRWDSVSLLDHLERYSPYPFLERLATGAHHRLAVRTRDYDIVWTALFDISEAAPVAREVLVLCPKSD